MSRSGYSDDCDQWQLIMWRGAVSSAIRGKRGQQLLHELVAGLDAMPVKELIAEELERDGSYCALGVVGAARGLPLDKIDSEYSDSVARAFGIASALAREIAYMNDDGAHWIYDADGRHEETPGERFVRMRAWAVTQLREPV